MVRRLGNYNGEIDSGIKPVKKFSDIIANSFLKNRSGYTGSGDSGSTERRAKLVKCLKKHNY